MDKETTSNLLSVYITSKQKEPENGGLICIDDFSDALKSFQKLVYALKPENTVRGDFKLYLRDYKEGSVKAELSFSDEISKKHQNYGILFNNTLGVINSSTEEEIEDHIIKNYGYKNYKSSLTAIEKIYDLKNLNFDLKVENTSEPGKTKYLRINNPNNRSKISKLKSNLKNILDVPIHGILYELDVKNKSFKVESLESTYTGTYQKTLAFESRLSELLKNPVEIYGKIDKNKRSILKIYDIEESKGVPLSSLGRLEFEKDIGHNLKLFKNYLNSVLESEGTLTRYMIKPTETLTSLLEKLENSLKFEYMQEERTAVFGNYLDLFLLFMDKYEENKNNSPLWELRVLFDKHLAPVISNFPERIQKGDNSIKWSIETYDIILKNEIQIISDEMFKIEKRYCDLLPCCNEIHEEFGKLPFDSETCEELRNNLKRGE